ncbi:MAG TPA: hypothetical protein VFE31_08615 [Opitutaceae bacterium]|nr:hypothetical protein [Opitutaceae bacterium]
MKPASLFDFAAPSLAPLNPDAPARSEMSRWFQGYKRALENTAELLLAFPPLELFPRAEQAGPRLKVR